MQTMLFLLIYYRILYFKKKEKEITNFPPVSIIITAKDEDENLKNNLPVFLSQDYPEFEVVVVNDQSEDDTEDVLDSFSNMHNNFTVVRIGQKLRKWPGKKLAVSLGIRRAKYEILLLSDADCQPASDQWIKTMVSNYNEQTEIVLGVSPYQWKPTFLNKIIQFDTLMTLSNFVGFTLAKVPYMGIGRNLSYKKEVFQRTGFGNQLHVPYGDDDLFVNESANKENTRVEFSQDSVIVSQPQENFGKWFRQKYRHLSAGKSYRRGHKIMLTFAAFLFPAFFISGAIAAILAPVGFVFLGVVLFRYIIYLLHFGLVAKKFSKTRLIFWAPVLEIFYHLLLIPYFSIYLTVKGVQKGW